MFLIWFDLYQEQFFYTGIAITIITMKNTNKNMPITKARKKQPSDDFFESFGNRKANGISHGHLFINQKPKIISQSVFIFQLLSAKIYCCITVVI